MDFLIIISFTLFNCHKYSSYFQGDLDNCYNKEDKKDANIKKLLGLA